jgi:hypothetical protein
MKNLVFCVAVLAAGARVLPASPQEGSFDRSLTVSGKVDLDVQTDSGGITVTRGSSGTVHVHAILKAQHGWLGAGDAEARIRELENHPPVEQDGNRIRVGYVHDHDLLRNISIRFEIQTPADTELRAHADSGGIRAEGLRGPVDCKTDSGGIEVREIEANVRAAADSGGVHMAGIKGSVYARVDSGGIEASDIAGSIDVQTDSGGVQIGQTVAAPIRAKVDSGGLTVRLAPNAGYDVNVEAESGHISVPEMTVRSGFSSHHIQGKVRGGGPGVEIHVDSGNVSIE